MYQLVSVNGWIVMYGSPLIMENGTTEPSMVVLETSNLDRFLINFIIVPFHSSSQFDCSFPVIPIISSCCVKMIPPKNHDCNINSLIIFDASSPDIPLFPLRSTKEPLRTLWNKAFVCSLVSINFPILKPFI